MITQLKHDFDQSERLHTVLMSVVKDSIPEQFKNILSSEEPRGKGGSEYYTTIQLRRAHKTRFILKHNPIWRFK